MKQPSHMAHSFFVHTTQHIENLRLVLSSFLTSWKTMLYSSNSKVLKYGIELVVYADVN